MQFFAYRLRNSDHLIKCCRFLWTLFHLRWEETKKHVFLLSCAPEDSVSVNSEFINNYVITQYTLHYQVKQRLRIPIQQNKPYNVTGFPKTASSYFFPNIFSDKYFQSYIIKTFDIVIYSHQSSKSIRFQFVIVCKRYVEPV